MWVNLFDPFCRMHIVDINPFKQGKYVLGTGHKIYSEKEIEDFHNACNVVVMNGFYFDEIYSLLNKLKGFDNIKVRNIEQILSEYNNL